MSKASDGPILQLEVITLMRLWRRWSMAEKARVIEKEMHLGISVSFVERPASVLPSQPFAWKRLMLEGGHFAILADENVVVTSPRPRSGEAGPQP